MANVQDIEFRGVRLCQKMSFLDGREGFDKELRSTCRRAETIRTFQAFAGLRWQAQRQQRLDMDPGQIQGFKPKLHRPGTEGPGLGEVCRRDLLQVIFKACQIIARQGSRRGEVHL